MRPITSRFSTSTPLRTSLLFILGSCLGILLIAGCDTSEDPNLLNPPRPDSTNVRVVNLIQGEPVGFFLSTFPVVTDLQSFDISPFSSFFIQEQFPIYVQSFGVTDTLRDKQLSSGVNTSVHMTYMVTGNSTARQVLTFITNAGEREDLKAAGTGRIYFINAVPEESFLLKRGCRAGDTLYSVVNGMSSGGAKDVAVGDYALYLFKAEGTSEEVAAHLHVEAGKVLFLIAADNGSGVKLYQLEANGTDVGSLPQAERETRTTAEIEVLNALDNKVITPHLLGDPNPLGQNIQPRTISQSTTIIACSDSFGDTIQVTADPNDTTNLPIRVGVGSKTLAAVYETTSGTHLLTLDRATYTPEAGTAYVRGVNLSRSALNVAVVVGAGAPAGVSADLRPFGELKPGGQSNYVQLPAGLYPLSLEQTINGGFIDGGLQNFAAGFYSLLILEENGAPAVYILRDDIPGSTPQRLQALGKRALFFSMASGITPRFEATTSAGTIVLESVPYSYVFPSILPAEQVLINVPGVGQRTVDISSQSYTVGATGSDGNYQLVSFPAPDSQPEQSKSNVRFLNAVPEAPPLDVYISSQGDPIATGLAFGLPSSGTLHDPRRYSFTVTRPPAQDTVAIIQGVQLSGGRNYLLVVGPKGPTTSSAKLYATLWMQE